MPSFRIDETVARPPIRAFELSEIDRANIKCLVGHTLARVERELILQTLESHQGNRTSSATLLGISVRVAGVRPIIIAQGEAMAASDASSSRYDPWYVKLAFGLFLSALVGLLVVLYELPHIIVAR